MAAKDNIEKRKVPGNMSVITNIYQCGAFGDELEDKARTAARCRSVASLAYFCFCVFRYTEPNASAEKGYPLRAALGTSLHSNNPAVIFTSSMYRFERATIFLPM